MRPNKIYVCFRLPTVSKLGHRPWFFYCRFWFFTINWFFSQKNVFCFKSISVATYIKNNFTKSVFVTFARSGQHVSRDQTVSYWKWRNNEPWHRVTDWKMSIKQFCFYKTYFRQTKLFQKIKKIIRPTYPNFMKHVTGNTHIFFVWPEITSHFRWVTWVRLSRLYFLLPTHRMYLAILSPDKGNPNSYSLMLLLLIYSILLSTYN